MIACGRCRVQWPLLLLLKGRLRNTHTLMLLLFVNLIVVSELHRVGGGQRSILVRLSHAVVVHDSKSIQSVSQNSL